MVSSKLAALVIVTGAFHAGLDVAVKDHVLRRWTAFLSEEGCRGHCDFCSGVVRLHRLHVTHATHTLSSSCPDEQREAMHSPAACRFVAEG
jgi:hypothetical protein